MRPLLGITLVALAVSGQMPSMRPDYDVIIRNGRVLDGSGNPWIPADIAISGGRVILVGRLPDMARATRVIDAAGLTVAPGFIDVHSHAVAGLDGALADGLPLLAQGVTTVFVNPDGEGPVDLAAQRASLERHGVGVNVAQFVPEGSIRAAVMGMADRAPTADELSRMEAFVKSGMEAGGLGLSTGLYYAPGSYAKTDEIIALATVASAFGGVYASHIRDEADYTIGVVAAVDEVIRIADAAHLPGVVSHMKALGPASWGLSMALATHIDQARAHGVAVFADQYPYDASGTSIESALIPRWAEAGGRAAFLARLDGGDQGRLRQSIAENLARRGGPATLVVSDYAPDHTLEGRSLAEIADSRHTDVVDLVVALLRQADGGLVSFNMSDADIDLIMRQPWTMTCSDGELTGPGQGTPHPRGYGAFARKLGVYARDRHVIGLAQAVQSMTGLPAAVFGLKDRGVLRRGARADLVVFDPATIRDRATYTNPRQLAEGVRFVLVNGQIALDEARPTGVRAGRFLSPERY